MSRLFRYRALTGDGRTVERDIEARSAEDAAARAAAEGHVPFDLRELSAHGGPIAAAAKSSLKLDAFAMLVRQLSRLTAAKLPLVEALDILARENEPATARPAARLRARVAEGSSFHDALTSAGVTREAVYLSLVRAGEATGDLGGALARIAEHVDNRCRMRDAVRGALAYPILLVAVAAISITVIFTTVIPALEPIFLSSGAAISGAAGVLIAISDFIERYGLAVLSGLLIFVLGVSFSARTKAGARALSQLSLATPFVSNIVQDVESARFARTLGALNAAKVPIIQALEIACSGVASHVLAERARAAVLKVREGRALSAALGETAGFSRIVAALTSVGERTGAMTTALDDAANLLERRAESRIKSMLGVAAPVLTLTIGAAVAAIILTVLSAILSVNEFAF